MQDFKYGQTRYDISRAATAVEIQSIAECFDSKRRRAASLCEIQKRAAEIKEQLSKLNPGAHDYASRYARLTEILNNLRGTLERCR